MNDSHNDKRFLETEEGEHKEQIWMALCVAENA